jgi:hypothetical protein
MSKIDFSKPIQFEGIDDSGSMCWLDCTYMCPHPDHRGVHFVWNGTDAWAYEEEALRNKPEYISTKKLYDNLYQEAVQDGLGWATPSQIKDMLFEKLVAFGMIDQEAVYEAK